MGLIEHIIQDEIVGPRRFARVEERDYGLLYYTPDIPESHYGNHACILHPRDIAAAIADVQDFYRSKELAPRVNHVSRPGGGESLRTALQAAGFQIQEDTSPAYVHRRPSSVAPIADLAIERVRSPSCDLLAMVEQSLGQWQMKVVRASLSCAQYHLLVGFLGAQPVTMAAAHAGPITCVDTVLTHRPYRGRGYARTVVHELVRYHSRVLGGAICLYTDNPTAVRIYEDAGFEKLGGMIECWSAWLPCLT